MNQITLNVSENLQCRRGDDRYAGSYGNEPSFPRSRSGNRQFYIDSGPNEESHELIHCQDSLKIKYYLEPDTVNSIHLEDTARCIFEDNDPHFMIRPGLFKLTLMLALLTPWGNVHSSDSPGRLSLCHKFLHFSGILTLRILFSMYKSLQYHNYPTLRDSQMEEQTSYDEVLQACFQF
ncbi:hypothetical protein BD289DRAFT_229456 [Coniella lustricola]|uniref:Uncharacterized protein n=1 Tax=Coniella lustricola TaxID=2025994 RepID=A0A2T3AAJ3_9PEZI|nr:hypothetical protein BD289DRAFT_229456 [Coniella lustricola]